MYIRCKLYGSVLYCFDENKNEIYAYPRQKIHFNKCPKSVIFAFINNNYDAEIVFNEVNGVIGFSQEELDKLS